MNGTPNAPDLSFPKALRLRRTAEFAKVRTEGRAFSGKLLTLGVLDTSAADASRFGLITSKTVGGAVVRNRVRRRLREIFRLHRHELKRGLWIVAIARAAGGRASYAALEGEWLRLANRASILAP